LTVNPAGSFHTASRFVSTPTASEARQ
jgi:hypothetical protein